MRKLHSYKKPLESLHTLENNNGNNRVIKVINNGNARVWSFVNQQDMLHK